MLPHARIVIVSDAWHPQINGVVTSLMETTRRLEARGHTVIIIHPGLFHTIPVPHYSEVRLSVNTRNLNTMITKAQPDYIHLNTEGPLGLAARAYCQSRGIAFTTSYHTKWHSHVAAWHIPALPQIVQRYLRWFHGAAAATMVATPALQQEMQEYGFNHVTVVPLGVDTDLFTPPLYGPREGGLLKPVFGYLGRISKEKSVEEFLNLPLPGTKLVIGDGPLRHELEKQHGAHARFVGYQKEKNLVHWLQQCDALVMPSVTETFGLVVVEALACGVPVAAHDVTGPREIITHGIDGYMSDNLEEAALACLTLSREACRKKALQFSWDASVDTFLTTLAPVRSTATTTSTHQHFLSRVRISALYKKIAESFVRLDTFLNE